jgi:hypothetical protein
VPLASFSPPEIDNNHTTILVKFEIDL